MAPAGNGVTLAPVGVATAKLKSAGAFSLLGSASFSYPDGQERELDAAYAMPDPGGGQGWIAGMALNVFDQDSSLAARIRRLFLNVLLLSGSRRLSTQGEAKAPTPAPASPTRTLHRSATPSPTASDLPTTGPTATSSPTPRPTLGPTEPPTEIPTPVPTAPPTLRPTLAPTATPRPGAGCAPSCPRRCPTLCPVPSVSRRRPHPAPRHRHLGPPAVGGYAHA